MKHFLTRWVWVILTLAGIFLLILAPALAIYEGYASDAEMRGGNILPAVVVGLLGAIAIVLGLVAEARRRWTAGNINRHSSTRDVNARKPDDHR